MVLLIAVTYVILSGFIIYLLVLLSSRNVEYRVETRNTTLAAEELQKHAVDIAKSHQVGKSAKSIHWLVRRLNENYGFITGIYRALNADIKDSFPTAPAAEWLLDNFYIIEEQVKFIKRNLSRGQYTRLPALKNGYLKGYPRVYAIALEIVAHFNGNVDDRTIIDFIQAYQSQSLLSMGELWAIPLMMRIALIESIRNVCEKIRMTRLEWRRAEEFVAYIASHEIDEQQIEQILDRLLEGTEKIAPPFVEHMLKKLRKHGKGLSTVTALLDRRLRDLHTSVEMITGAEHQMQAEMQVSIGNSITGLRLISDLDWSEIFEMLSKTEQILRQDPIGIYGMMDFESRDYYRHEVEKLARAFGVSEIHVACSAIECARNGIGRTPQDHVGYYLVGKGRKTLLDMLGGAAGKRRMLSFAAVGKPRRLYTGMILFITAFMVSYFMYYSATRDNGGSAAWPVITALLVLIPCSELAIKITNTIMSHIYRPAMLPKLEMKDGIPAESATFVIIPTLLTNPARVQELLRKMEVYYLANRESNLFFALVGDYRDAPLEKMENDEMITGAALAGIAELNRKYSGNGPDIFYYMHRKRSYNASQERWMGWERKRGAIVEFNRLLRNEADTGFEIISGDVSKLPDIKYVITLDADTNLPMGAAKKLIGTISHPLNRAVVDEKTGLVKEGHGILQPRISIDIPSANRSLFTRIFAGQGGIDPYTTAVSDIYQDIFDEGIFAGKGIYEVDVFRKVLDGRIPDNTVLSHDLIEGCHLRAGLVSDIELVDGYPGGYSSFAARQHRWTRGDWQLLPWLAGKVRDRDGNIIRNHLSSLSKWKILDNIRSSLLHPSILALILAGVGLLPGNELVWVFFAVLIIFLPLVTGLLNGLLAGNPRFGGNKTNSTVITGIRAAAYQSVIMLMLVPHQAFLMADAIARTIYRVFISHRNMLEWVTAADVEANLKNNAGGYLRKMWFSLTSAAAIMLLAVLSGSGRSLVAAAVLGALWLVSPLAAYHISKPVRKKRIRLPDDDLAMLRKVARMTWRYFEDFAGENDNYLPPDNFQEDPPKGVAHRTSPTNIGLLLISVVSACDMGYIGWNEMAERLSNTISTMEKLEKWNGHLFNWYNTITLETLRPLYVSTVDSGNLAGYMMVARESLKEYLKRQTPQPAMASGLKDTLELVRDEDGIDAGEKIRQSLTELSNGESMDLTGWADVLEKIGLWLKSEKPGLSNGDDRWITKLGIMVRRFTDELYAFYPHIMRPELAKLLEEQDPGLAESMLRAGSPEELLLRYRSAIDIINRMQNKPGKTADGNAEFLASQLHQAISNIKGSIEKHDDIIERLSKLIVDMKFSPLFDNKRLLFSIGYNVEDGHLSKSYYDLLASEARQASYIAIARGEVDRRHWVRLGRKMAVADGGKVLVSWTGTMFEYLMPLLIMRNYENTILDETYSCVVRVQKKYARQRHIPWGISESGYSSLDLGLNYQYSAFGVPILGLKRGLANDMVVSPYSSILALGIDPAAVVENLKELARLGMESKWGFYEAIDFTPSRLKKNENCRIVKCFMAHHQGMSLAALNNFFNLNVLHERFHADPVIKSAELLLQEKLPGKVLYTKEYKNESALSVRRVEYADGEAVRYFGIPKVIPPHAHMLSNGSYSVMITDGGSGYSKNGDLAVTRWTADYFVKSGFYIFIQNINSNTTWSATYDPLGDEPDKYRVIFSPDKAEFIRRNGNIESHLEVTVSPEDSAEVRRISIINHSNHTRVVELTSYFEAVLSPQHEDAAHPAFNKLFVKTEYDREHMCLLAVRRQKKEWQKPLWLVHTMAVEGDVAVGEPQYETDRMKFIGRNRDISNPQAMKPDQPLSNSTGPVLDPVMCIRRRIKIGPGQTVRAAYAVACAHTKKHALELAKKYNDYRTSERTFELSWTRSQVESRYLGLNAHDIEFYLELIPFLLFSNPLKKEFADSILDNTGAQQELWPFGISGDLPIVLVEVDDNNEMDKVYWALKGHEFWRMKGLTTDLVIMVNKNEGYSQPLNDQVRDAVASSHARELVNRRGGVFIINSGEMEQIQKNLFYTVAKIVVREGIESLKNSVKKARKFMETAAASFGCNGPDKLRLISAYQPAQDKKLLFFNGLGGFTSDGREYVILLGSGRHTPAPWVNIIAGKNFGFIVTESGGGYTWAENSREFKLTPWANDPVTDRQGEIFYIKDLDEQCHWSMTPAPVGDNEPYTVRHGFGYTVFEHDSYGIGQSLTMFAAIELPVKICIAALRNFTGRTRNLTITYYTRPVLGVDDCGTSPYIVTWNDENGILYAENKFTQDFRGRVMFLSTNAKNPSVTGDRTAFIGRGGDAAEPHALLHESLDGVTGAGLDPCAAISGKVRLEPEEEVKVVFLLGSAANSRQAAEYAGRFSNAEAAENELERVKLHWAGRLGAIQVHTPDDSFDVIMNGWLLYQTISCRLMARTGYYQAGGAYGFRDQLQDCMAVLNTWPELTRNQLLLHASRQFVEGDVQHWWHAERGRGIRTRYSDDLLWLAYVTAEYLEKTGDESVLAEQVPFIEGSALKENEDEKYEEPVRSGKSASLYEHCVLAIDRALKTGPHGLPLIGGGDWNDGMNEVGYKGRGESVWLGWFLISILRKFEPICNLMKDYERAEKYRKAASTLLENIEREAWDGSWYRRAFFDDGTPLGSVQNSECMIDSISQSWSVIAGLARSQRMHEAMDAVLKYLVDGNEGIIKLLTPPFDEGGLSPGYIKGYVPGVRENGGQYTHAAAWVVLAFTLLGRGDKAAELFHMLNPVNHTRTQIEYSRYKVEPYVIAADVYAVHPNMGRGGWTWYTGAAGWLYKVGLEYIAGFRKKGDRLYINPCIPGSWSGFVIEYRNGEAVYRIEVKNPDGVCCGVVNVFMDGKPCRDGCITLFDSGFHRVELIMGAP